LESDNKLVVGLYHKHAMEDLYSHFKKIAVFIDGSVTGQKRQDAVDIFQKDKKVKLILCQIKTVPGLTLTAAPATCTIEFSWAPADHLQFEDRVHRIGQEADSVTAYYLIAPGTVDEDSMAMVNNKFTVLTQVLDGKDNADIFDNSFLLQILKKYKKKRL
jgi:SWI/SNF-related matrix-associated actin-dependent regulator 1 of chromatin subfamily A